VPSRQGTEHGSSTACAAAPTPIGDAYRLIQLGLADAMVCGGAIGDQPPLGVPVSPVQGPLLPHIDDPDGQAARLMRSGMGFVIGGRGRRVGA